MLVNEQKIINILPHEVKDAYDFLLNKNAPAKEQQIALEAVKNLLKLEPDTETLAATILFQVPQISDKDLREMKTQFGQEVVGLVKDLMKFSRIPTTITANEKRKTFIRKAILVLTKDIRGLYIKLATRLAKLKIQKVNSGSTLEKSAKEAFEIHAPLAGILGLWELRCEIEDICFRYLYPEEHQKILLYRSHKKSINEQYISRIEKTVSDMAKTLNIPHTIEVKLKNLYEIHKKQTRKFNSNSLKDILSFQIIAPTTRDCYRMLGLIHSIWKPKHKTLKDYISIPKMNGYQAIHTTVFGPNERVCLFQITTPEMIKQRRASISKDKLVNKNAYKWLKSTIDTSYEPDAQLLTSGLSLEKNIFIFTNKGKIINLPKRSTCVDAAYNMSSNTGKYYGQAFVNGLKVPPSHTLQTGDTVKIQIGEIPDQSQINWVEYTHTEQAKKGIQKLFKEKLEDEQKEIGLKKLNKNLKRVLNTNFKQVKKILEKKLQITKEYSSIEEVLLGLGKAEINVRELFTALFTNEELSRNKRGSNDATELTIKCVNKLGMLSMITDKITNRKLNMLKVSTKLDDKQTKATITIVVDLENFRQLYKLIDELERIDGILEVYKS